jgi:hypothetical protein
MEIRFANPEQAAIADLMWAARDLTEVQAILNVFGVAADIVYNMIIAASIDEQVAEETEFPFVLEILESVK